MEEPMSSVHPFQTDDHARPIKDKSAGERLNEAIACLTERRHSAVVGWRTGSRAHAGDKAYFNVNRISIRRTCGCLRCALWRKKVARPTPCAGRALNRCFGYTEASRSFILSAGYIRSAIQYFLDLVSGLKSVFRKST